MTLWNDIQTGFVKAVGFLDTPFGAPFEVVNSVNGIAIGQIIPGPLGNMTAECAGAINYYPNVDASLTGTMDDWVVTGNGQTMTFDQYCNRQSYIALDQSATDLNNSGLVAEIITTASGQVVPTGRLVSTNPLGNLSMPVILAGAGVGLALLVALTGRRR